MPQTKKNRATPILRCDAIFFNRCYVVSIKNTESADNADTTEGFARYCCGPSLYFFGGIGGVGSFGVLDQRRANQYR